MKATDFLFGEVSSTENGEEKIVGLAVRYEDFQIITHKDPEWFALTLMNKGNSIRKVIVRDHEVGISPAPVTKEEMDIDALFDDNGQLCGCIVKIQDYSVFFKADDNYNIKIEACDKTVKSWEVIPKDADGRLPA